MLCARSVVSLRRVALAGAFGLLLAFVPLPTYQRVLGVNLDRSPLSLRAAGAETVGEMSAVADEPLDGDRLVGQKDDVAPFTALAVSLEHGSDQPVFVR